MILWSLTSIIRLYRIIRFDEDNDDDVFYAKIDDNIYRKIHINRLKSETRFVNMNSINNNSCVYASKTEHLKTSRKLSSTRLTSSS